jgi:tetratricopeptide (TPR) repeat protein
MTSEDKSEQTIDTDGGMKGSYEYDVFVSCSEADEEWVDSELLPRLQEIGLRCADVYAFRPGGARVLEIDRIVRASRWVLLIVSPDYLQDNWAHFGDVLAATRGVEAGQWRVIPILLRHCELPERLKPLVSVNLSANAEREWARLISTLLSQPSLSRYFAWNYDEGRPRISSSGVVALHQLPPPPTDFTGREAELSDLAAEIARGGTTILGLYGIGGVGKTALALKLAELLMPRYPDGQFYVDLRGTSDDPLTPTEAMAHVIRAYHPTAELPEREIDLQNLYRSVLHNQRAIVLLDNARDRAQVESLSSPKSCVLLVTSRWHFALPGLHAVHLDVLPLSDARQFLLKIAPRIGDATDEIAQLCGCLPFALRLAGSAIAERVDLRPEYYLRRLEEEQGHFSEVDASLTLSYGLLSEDHRILWCMLAVFPGAFSWPAASAVWALEADAARDKLSELVRYSLVEWDRDTERYWLHSSARLFARDRLGEKYHREAARRHAIYYYAALAAADRLYLQGGESIRHGLDIFDLEKQNIETGQKWAEAHTEQDRMGAQLCGTFPVIGWWVLSRRQSARDQLLWSEAGLQAARHLKDRSLEVEPRAVRHPEDRSLEAELLGNVGNAYRKLGQVERAVEYNERALAVARESGDRLGESRHLASLGNAYVFLEQAERAIEYHDQALVITRETCDRRGEAVDLANLGTAYALLRQRERATEYYEQALAIAREIGDRISEATYLGNLGGEYVCLGKVERGIEYQEQALAIAREFGDYRGEGFLLSSLGNTYRNLKQMERATEYYEQALAVDREADQSRSEKWHLSLLGDAYRNLGQVERAIEYHERALDITRKLGDRRAEGGELGNLGNAYAALGKGECAIEHYEQGLAIAREIGDRQGEGRHLGNLGSAYRNLGQAQRAIGHHEQALAIARETGDRRNEGTDLANLGHAYAILGQMDRAIEYCEQALAIARETGDRHFEGIHLRNLGNAYRSQGQVERAIEYYEQALLILHETHARREEGNVIGVLGGCHTALGKVERAIGCFEQALSIAREIGDKAGESYAHLSLGRAHCHLGQADRSLSHFEQALELSRRTSDRRSECRASCGLGDAYLVTGQMSRVGVPFIRVLFVLRSVIGHRSLSHIFFCPGKKPMHLMRWEKAIGCYRQALTIAREIGLRKEEGDILGSLGNAYCFQQKLEQAIETYEQSLSIHREIGDRAGEGADLGNLGKVYCLLRQTKRAIEYENKAIDIAHAIGDRARKGNYLLYLGVAQAELGNGEDARECAQAALGIFQETKSPYVDQARMLLAVLPRSRKRKS